MRAFAFFAVRAASSTSADPPGPGPSAASSPYARRTSPAASILAAASVFAVASAVLSAASPHPASAQRGSPIAGIVTDAQGTPLEGVVVEAWSADGLVAARITREDGAFSFPARLAPEVVSLRATRLGYRVLEQLLEGSGAGEGRHVLRLEEEPISIRGLIVDSQRQECRIEDEERARGLWRAMSRKYTGAMDTVGIATYLAEEEAMVDRDEIGPLDLPPEKRAQRGSSSQLRFSLERQVRRSGYALAVRRTDMGSSFDSWSYPPLEADFAPHFVDETFADLHRFRVLDEGSFGWIVEFCPDDRERPSILGTLRLAPDTTLLKAEWLFRTPDPDESAGGEAVFPPATAPPGENHPLPVESIVWRRLPTGEFREVHQRYEEWIVAQGDTVPFLPRR